MTGPSQSKSTRSPNFLIITNRLQISHFKPTNQAHTTFLANLWNTPDFIAFNGGKTSIPSPETAAEYLRTRVDDDFARNGYGDVSRLSDTDGELYLHKADRLRIPNESRRRLTECLLGPGYRLRYFPEESGNGYATEAASGLLEYVQREMGIDELLEFCGKDDARSARVLEKTGMKFRGVRKLKLFGGGKVWFLSCRG